MSSKASRLMRTFLLAGVCGPMFFVAATPAAAQSGDDVQTDDGDIVVVARKREERLVDVPISITAISQETIQKLGATDMSAMQGAIPNVNLVQGRGSTSSANFFIRGIGQPDALQTFDPAVGIYVDGVYMSRIQGGLMNLGDVERVEVLRGPQGSLYGKNTIGGAVNIISRKPDMSNLIASGNMTYGSYNQIVASGYVSAPLATDKAALSLAAQYDKRDGIVTDPVTGRKYNDRDSWSTRAILALEPIETVRIRISGDYTKQRNALTLGYATAPLISGFGAALSPAEPLGPYAYNARTSFTGNEGQKLDHWGVSGNVELDVTDNVTLASITAYRWLKPQFYVDIDATQLELGDVFVGVRQHQFSQELQLKYDSGSLKGVFGLYYLNESIRSHQEAYADNLFAPFTFTRFIDDRQSTKSYAAFGQLTYDLSEKLSLTAGLRYTKDDKSYNRTTVTSSTAASLNGLTFTFPTSLPAPYNTQNTASFDAWTPMATLSYKPGADSMLYLSASRGFKSGGFNGRANGLADLTFVVGGTPTIVTRFAPEKVWTYEAGAKANLADGKVRLSGAAFWSDYRDFQARVGGGSAGAFPVLNAGKLQMSGFEFDAVVRPVQALTLSTSLGYLNAKYKEFNDGRRAPSFSCNPTGLAVICKPAFAPPITLRVAADYRMPIGDVAALTFGGEARFVDKHWLSVDNRPGLKEDGYWLTNAYIQADLSRNFYLRGAVKNLGKALYKADGQEFSNVGNIQTVYYGDPRTWNLTAGFRF